MARRQRNQALTEPRGLSAAGPFASFLSAETWKRLGRNASSWVERQPRIKAHEATFILRNLATLVDNGVPLPRALATLAKEDSLAHHREALDGIRRKVESGVPFSSALAELPRIWDRVSIAQIRVGERSGTLAATLKQLAETRHKTRELRQQVARKLAYPALLTVFGSGLILFLLLYVVPVFEETYRNAKVPLPFITQLLIGVGDAVQAYLPYAVGLAVGGAAALQRLRRNEAFAARCDRALLKSPIFGSWLRDMAVLQFMEALHNLMTAGFTLAESLGQAADSVGNRAVRGGARQLLRAVQRGERFSRELERHDEIFPPIVNQLAVVGEQTGQLTRATFDICDHLRREIERKTVLMVGALEPILTILLAAAIAVVLLAIYLPMFDMVGAVS